MMHSDRQIPGWFPEVNRNHLIHLMRKHDVKIALEIGAFLGKTTAFFLNRLKIVHAIDYFRIDCLRSQDEKNAAYDMGLPLDFEAIFWDNIREAGKSIRMYDLYVGRPDQPPRELSAFPPDLLYIDGDHSYEGVWNDIHAYGPLTKKIICGDDYGVAEGVERAVNERFGDRVKTAPPFWWVEV